MALQPCKECGKQISTEATMCPHCGKKPAKGGMGAGTGCFVVIGVLILLGVIGLLMTDHSGGGGGGGQPQNESQGAKSTTPKFERPSIPPPKYRVYRQVLKEGLISVVVVPATTDDQLKSLLWFFREKIRARKLRELGVSQGFEGSGILAVYRSDKCANEEFINELGPCGYGEHDDAYYQWGVSGDPNKDEGGLQTKDGNRVTVFNFSDNWQLPPEDQAGLQAEAKRREDFANALSLSYQQEGLDVSASVDGTTLELESKLLEDVVAREAFIQQLFSNKKVTKQLCDSGFRVVYVHRFKGLFAGDVGRRVSLGCQ